MKTLSAAILSTLVVANAGAAGLGRMTVMSALGQPLRAEIELTAVSKDEVGALAAKLASADAFRQSNVEFNSALMSLRFDVQHSGDRQFIRVTSTQPLNEPFIDMLLELSGPNGRLIREYTFLLDPPELRTSQSAAIAPAPVPQLGSAGTQAAAAPQQPAAASSRRATQSAVQAPAAQTQPAPAADAADAPSGDYQVRDGDTLTRIAAQAKPAGVSLDQMLVALFQSNPDAFVEKNMNRLKSGQILSLPSAEAAAAVDAGEARSMIVAQAADFNAYRQRLAGQVASAAAQPSADARQGAGGRITARVEERATPATESRDKLQLSHATAGTAGVSAEDLIARDKALAESQAREKELERNISDLQKLLELKNAELAEQQKRAGAANAGSPAPAPAAAQADPAAATAAAPAVESKPEPVAPAPAVPAPVAVAPKPAPMPVVAPPPPPDLIDELLGNPLTLPGLGGLLVVLGGLGIYRIRRQKKSKQFEDSIITDSSLKANSLFGSTGGQSVDTNNSVFNSSFTPSVSQLDSNEVDPVAEADVYIAYGRDAQAEEILKEALRTQPDRQAVRVKLLEIYSNRKDLRAFEVLATELYGLTKGAGDEWAQAAAMGVALDPNNPLYASAKSGSSSMVAPTQPLEEQGLATLLSATQGDTGAMDTISSLESDTAYFNNTEAAEEPAEEVAEPVAEEPAKAASNELDFDLDGMNLDMEVPNTIPRPAAAEPPAALASIDFDFLDTKAQPVEPVAEPEIESEVEIEKASAADTLHVKAGAEDSPSLDDLEFALNEMAPQETTAGQAEPAVSDLTFEITKLDDALDAPVLEADDVAAPVTTDTATSEHSPMDFDLSDISLELSADDNAASADAAVAENYGTSEMATKLDLAIAYQEIGDKEGARELLDEVLKGGTPEQSEKAKSLLLELA